MTLLDTNILLRLSEYGHVHYPLVRRAMRFPESTREDVCYVPQTMVEFWAVRTRPLSANGQGFVPREAAMEAADIEAVIQIFPDNEEVHRVWRSLVAEYSVSGRQVHDARLVAVTMVHGIDQILTFNAKDFARYRTIRVLDPRKIPDGMLA